jgi:hypothetical protein
MEQIKTLEQLEKEFILSREDMLRYLHSKALEYHKKALHFQKEYFRLKNNIKRDVKE